MTDKVEHNLREGLNEAVDALLIAQSRAHRLEKDLDDLATRILSNVRYEELRCWAIARNGGSK